MSAATDQLTDVQAKAFELLEQIQEPIVEGVRSAAEQAESVLPEVKVPYLDTVGSIQDYVDFGFGVVDAIVKNQKAFVADLLSATADVRAKFVDAAAKPVAPVRSATKKAA
jgi:hypothetical protein